MPSLNLVYELSKKMQSNTLIGFEHVGRDSELVFV